MVEKKFSGMSLGESRMIGFMGGLRTRCAGVVGAGGILYQNGPGLSSIGASLNRGFGFLTLKGLCVLNARCCDPEGAQSISSPY